MRPTPRKENRIHHSGPTDDEQFAFAPTEQMQGTDLNHATAQQLRDIEGMDDSLVDALIEYRTHRGHFSSWEELNQIPGMNTAALQCLQRAARIGGS